MKIRSGFALIRRLVPAWLICIGATFMLSLTSCSPDVSQRLTTLEARQDSLLRIVTSMQDKQDFMAGRMGWRPPPDTTPKNIPVGASFTSGAEKPVLTIVEFSDLECHFCAQVVPVLDSLVKSYPNQVRLVFKNFPLSMHANARAAAAAAMAAGKQGRFYEYRSALAPRYRELSDEVFLAVAQEIGLDMARFEADRQLTPEIERLLDEDMELGRELGVDGTPTLFVNGRLAESRSYRYFETLLKRGG